MSENAPVWEQYEALRDCCLSWAQAYGAGACGRHPGAYDKAIADLDAFVRSLLTEPLPAPTDKPR